VISTNVDYFFTAFFALESLIKSIAMGFITDRGSYLRESWNQLDFFIVVTSIVDVAFESVNIAILKVKTFLTVLDTETS
jgi:hypothetical protein